MIVRNDRKLEVVKKAFFDNLCVKIYCGYNYFDEFYLKFFYVRKRSFVKVCKAPLKN